MRFRYFDESGTEVEVSTVEALSFRIQTGAVQADTLLYDAAVGEWAPAGEHSMFQFLMEEASGSDDEREPAGVDPWSGSDLADRPAPESPGGSETEDATSTAFSSGTEPAAPAPETSGSGSGASSAAPSPSPIVVATSSRSWKGRAPGFRTLLVGGVVGLAAFAGALLILSDGDARPTPLFTTAEGSAQSGTTVPVVSERSVDDGARPEPPRDQARLATLTADVSVAATDDLARALLELQAALELPEEPPETWLEGIYLADAPSYPEVRRYWERFGNSMAATRALEGQLFRGFVKDHVARMGLDGSEADLLSARVLARFAAASKKREVLYNDLETLAAEAVALHLLLERRSDAVSYEPFRDGRLSRDPVIEAVADDPELAEEIWGHVDRIFNILERIQGIGPVSTGALQEAVLHGIRLPETAGS